MAIKIVAKNKKAFHDYDILDRLEAGMVLTGDEVKALRAGSVSLTGSFATVHAGELYLINCHITPYDKAFSKKEEDTRRRRKLLPADCPVGLFPLAHPLCLGLDAVPLFKSGFSHPVYRFQRQLYRGVCTGLCGGLFSVQTG